MIGKDTWYGFPNFVKICFVTFLYDPGKCLIRLKENVYFAAVGWNVLHIHLLGPFVLKYSSSPLFPYRLSVWIIYLYFYLYYLTAVCYCLHIG